MKEWKFRAAGGKISTPEPAAAAPIPTAEDAALAERLGISTLLLRLLRLRGMEDVAGIDDFLSPNLRLLAPPETWPGIPEAAAVLTDALRQGRTLAVWGDYDVDGITSTALVLDVLETHGMPVRSYLPDRSGEGYGLNIPALEKLAAEGVGALLTVDCGISDVAAVARARELGMIVVVSDHHLPPAALPPAHAICNPRLAPCPCPQLAGVGVAFFLMAAVNAALEPHTGKRHDLRDVLDLVALGTLADVVRLTGQNRILVKNGLLKIAEAARPGMAALKSVCKLAISARVGAGQAVFTLTPRINAAGRMGQAQAALDTLRAATFEEGRRLALRLDTMNTERRKEEERICQEARVQAESFTDHAGLVLYGKNWHPGVIGIVASRIVEEFHRPTLILCDSGSTLKGSGRSVGDFDLHAGLTSLADILLGYGGHRLAAGLRLEAGRLEDLRARFEQAARAVLGDAPSPPTLTLDAELDFAQAGNAAFLRELELLQPFGPGNAEPVFASPPLYIRDRRTFGYSRDHVVLDVTDETTGITLPAKAWRMAEVLPESLRGKRVRLAYTPRIDSYNGADSVDVRIRDWKPA